MLPGAVGPMRVLILREGRRLPGLWVTLRRGRVNALRILRQKIYNRCKQNQGGDAYGVRIKNRGTQTTHGKRSRIVREYRERKARIIPEEHLIPLCRFMNPIGKVTFEVRHQTSKASATPDSVLVACKASRYRLSSSRSSRSQWHLQQKPRNQTEVQGEEILNSDPVLFSKGGNVRHLCKSADI